MEKPSSKFIYFWFRRDLRMFDNAGLYHALKSSHPIRPIFIFDTNILDKLENKKDRRVEFIHNTIKDLKLDLEALGSSLDVFYGNPIKIWRDLAKDINLKAVFTNRDYETYAIGRDQNVNDILKEQGKSLHTFKDQVIFEANEVCKSDGNPYVVFTPYKRRWLEKLESLKTGINKNAFYYFKSYPSAQYQTNFLQFSNPSTPTLKEMSFEPAGISFPKKEVSQKRIKLYDNTRDYPSLDGTSQLGIHFRFGTISIREKARKALDLNNVYLSELIWRDFYSMILQHFPKVEVNSFREKYDRIEWRNKEEEFLKWCNGMTGYPIVDAGMRELNETGFMHNRVRMVAASFLTKHLLIDWRWGERYFAEKLLDFDLASNSGGWQWAAGCGTDAAPYFRIFNPYTQALKFDKEKKYIKKWVPEVDTNSYPNPIVDHKEARERCLSTYKSALKDG